MVEKLHPNIEGRLWKGPDIKTKSSVLLDKLASTTISVVLTRKSLPSSSDSPEGFDLSTRSRLAQAGLEFHSIDEKGNVRVTNHCQRPIYLEENFAVFRFFKETSNAAVDEKTLHLMFEEGRIKIDGKEGVDWEWSRKNGLFVRVKKEGRKWIPSDPANSPIAIDGNVLDYRKSIDSLFKPIPVTENQILWVGETPRVTLPEDVEVVLGKSAFYDFRDIRRDETGRQINSRLIDGGETNWPIRVEILSSTIPEKIPNFVHLRFIRNGRH